MHKLLPLILALPAIAAASDVSIQGNLVPRSITPTFDHGYLAVYDYGSTEVYAPDGKPAMKIETPSGASVVNADIDSNGSVALASLLHQSGAGRTGRISVFNPDGSPAGEIATGTYIPAHVCFAPDRSIWTLGDKDAHRGQQPDYFLLRHYSREGQLIGQYFPKSSFGPEIQFTQIIVGMWRLRIADGRVGFMVQHSNGHSLWVEADFTGKEIGRWPLPQSSDVAAMTASGLVYAHGTRLTVLDRASGSWKLAPQSSNDILLGAEGDALVYAVRGTNQIHRIP